MVENLICPRAAERVRPPEQDEPVNEACWDCPALLKQFDERGTLSLYCLVYRNRFSATDPSTPVAAPPSEAAWSWERVFPPEDRDGTQGPAD